MFGNILNDPLFSLLKTAGYNAVRLPKPNIKPTQLLTKKKGNDLVRLGELSMVFISKGNISSPHITEN